MANTIQVVLQADLYDWISDRALEWHMTRSEVVRRCIVAKMVNDLGQSELPKNYETKGE